MFNKFFTVFLSAFIALVITATSFGQAVLFEDNFDSYIVGQQLACQNPVDWTTWSGAPCGAEDMFISDAQSFSGANSFVTSLNQDLVKPLGTLTSGKWTIEFMIYIPDGQWGYFNTLAVTPLTGTTNWGMQVYFEASNTARMDAGGASSAIWTYQYDSWTSCVVIVDLDNDLAEFWFDGTLILSWQWTLGTFGNGSPLQLDGNNFFGATATDEMYVDDYRFTDKLIPVELTSFAANVNNEGQVNLNWSTASELNNQMFEIERRSEESQFVTIGFVEGYGTTTETQEYSYLDRTVITGTYFYRLKQIDFDGRNEYSDEVEVEVLGPLAFGLDQNYPNPFNPSTTIKYSIAASGYVKLAVYTMIGEEVSVLVDGQVESGFYEVNFDASNLPSGAYFYRLTSDNSVEIKKMLLMK